MPGPVPGSRCPEGVRWLRGTPQPFPRVPGGQQGRDRALGAPPLPGVPGIGAGCRGGALICCEGGGLVLWRCIIIFFFFLNDYFFNSRLW